jgi:transcriptional regulator with XRE-family HTH domain
MHRLSIFVGNRIRSLRRQAGLTIEQLSEMADLDGGFIACIENGRKTPSLHTLLKLSEALHVPISNIFSEHDVKVQHSFDHQVATQIRAIMTGKPPAERRKFLVVLRTLKNRDILSAVFDLLHTANRTRRSELG